MSIQSILVLACVPLLVALLDRAEQSLGSARAGWISGFPIVGAPALLIVTLVHGPAFGAEAASSAAWGVLGWAAFICTFRLRISVRGHLLDRGRLVAMSVLAWLAVTACILVTGPPHIAAAMVLPATVVLALRLGEVSTRPGGPVRSALQARAALAVGLVLLTVVASNTLGGRAAGLLAAFPIVSSSLLVPVAVRGDRSRVAAMTKGMLIAGPALATYMFVLSVLLAAGLGTALPFVAATAAALGIHVGMWQVASARVGVPEDHGSTMAASYRAIPPPVLHASEERRRRPPRGHQP